MKTQRQWQKQWDGFYSKYNNNENMTEETKEYLTTLDLLLAYTGHDKHSIFYSLSASIQRSRQGNLNNNYPRDLKDILRERLNEFHLNDFHYPKTVGSILKTSIQQELLDNATISIYRYGDLANILRVINQKTGYFIATKWDDHGSDHLAGALKDIISTFRPYKYSSSDFYIKRDLKQPFTGLQNVAHGFASIVASPFIFVRNVFKLIFCSRSHDNSMKSLRQDITDNAKLTLSEPLSHLSDGLFRLGRGLTQIIATPLTYLIKIPLRYLLTSQQDASKVNETLETRIRFGWSNEILKNTLLHANKTDYPEYKKIFIAERYRKHLVGSARGEKTKVTSNAYLINLYSIFEPTPETSSQDNTMDTPKPGM